MTQGKKTRGDSLSRAAAALGRRGGAKASPAQRANSRRTDRGGGRPATIYVVEIPHQGQVEAWAEVEERAIALVAEIAANDAEYGEGITSLADIVKYLGRDRHVVWVYRGAREARAALKRDSALARGHLGIAAVSALRQALARR